MFFMELMVFDSRQDGILVFQKSLYYAKNILSVKQIESSKHFLALVLKTDLFNCSS